MHLATHSRPLFALFLALALLASPATAVDWSENGDAGELPSGHQTTIGVGPLTSVSGTIDNTSDRDLFCIRVVDQGLFLANLLCSSDSGLDLWLFSTTGLGITHNDACSGGFTSMSGAFKPGLGSYLLGVSANEATARNAGGQAIWAAGPLSGERAPDGPGAPGPIASWAPQSAGAEFTPYTVQLSGCVPCDAVVQTRARSWGALKLHHR